MQVGSWFAHAARCCCCTGLRGRETFVFCRCAPPVHRLIPESCIFLCEYNKNVLSQFFIFRTEVCSVMLFYSFFKSLVGKDVVVELKNDLSICGTLHSVDQVHSNQPLKADSHFVQSFQYLNIKLTDISVTDPDKYPHMLSVKNCFIRGSVVR